MLPRFTDRVLESLIDDRGKEANFLRKLTANKERNWFLAMVLNSFGKLASDIALTDLEQSIVNAFRENGFDEKRLKEHGRLYHKIPDQMRNEIFSDNFNQFTPHKKYTTRDLQKDAPRIVRSILHMENVTNVDMQAIYSGRTQPDDIRMVPMCVLQEHGSAMFIALAPSTDPLHSPCTIKAMRFRCNDETGRDWSGSDEVYWIFGLLGNDIAVTTQSQVFMDVDTGEFRAFDENEGYIWGQNGTPQNLPDGEIGLLVSLLEHDHGNAQAVSAVVKATFAAASAVLNVSDATTWVSAVTAGASATIQWLLKHIGDEPIADHIFVFNRQAVEDRLKKSDEFFTVTRRFADGNGDYTLKIRMSRVG